MAVERKTPRRKNAVVNTPSVSEYGRLQPQAIELEEGVNKYYLSANELGLNGNNTKYVAVANAEGEPNRLNRNDLKVKRAAADPGPMLRRYRPKARGSAGRIHKRTSNFTVILTDEK